MSVIARILALALLVAQNIQGGGQPAVMVAAGVAEGELYPVGRFARGAWTNTWPAAVEKPGVLPSLSKAPTTWLAGPVPRSWKLFHAAGDAEDIRIEGLRHQTGGCVQPTVLVYSPIRRLTGALPL